MMDSSTIQLDAVADAPRLTIPEGEDEALRRLSLEERSLTLQELPLPGDLKHRSKSKSPVQYTARPLPDDKQIIQELLSELKNKKGQGPNTVIISGSTGVQIGDTTNISVTNSVQYSTQTSRNGHSSNSKPHSPKKRKYSRKDEYSALQSSTEEITEADIDVVRFHIGKGWRDLGRKLQYNEGQLDQFQIDHSTLGIKEILYKMLIDWKRNSDNATVGNLSTSLYEAKEYSALHKLYKHRVM